MIGKLRNYSKKKIHSLIVRKLQIVFIGKKLLALLHIFSPSKSSLDFHKHFKTKK